MGILKAASRSLLMRPVTNSPRMTASLACSLTRSMSRSSSTLTSNTFRLASCVTRSYRLRFLLAQEACLGERVCVLQQAAVDSELGQPDVAGLRALVGQRGGQVVHGELLRPVGRCCYRILPNCTTNSFTSSSSVGSTYTDDKDFGSRWRPSYLLRM